MTCDCCGGTYVDEAGAMLIWEAADSFRDAVLRERTLKDAAVREASSLTEKALAAFRSQKGV